MARTLQQSQLEKFSQEEATEEEVVDLKGAEIEEEGVLTQGHPQGKKQFYVKIVFSIVFLDQDQEIDIEKEEATCAQDLALILDHQNREADREIIKKGQEDPDHNY